MTAGMEGGSPDAIEDKWDLRRVGDQRSYWSRHGPPTHIAVAALAASWGVKLTADDDAPHTAAPDAEPIGICGPTIAELAAAAGPVGPGCDTLAASRLIAEKLRGGT